MIGRRQFTITLVLTPLAAWLAANCGGNDSATGSVDGTTSTTSPTIPCDGLGSRSTTENGHAHDLCVPARDLTSPPSGGATYTTTTVDGHTHDVRLEAAQLSALDRGEVVRVTTATAEGHVHTYALARADTVSPSPPPTNPGGPSGSGGY